MEPKERNPYGKGSMPEDRKVDMGCIKSPLVISEGIHA